VAPVIAKIIKKFKKEGIVASAEKTVMKGRLYPLLY